MSASFTIRIGYRDAATRSINTPTLPLGVLVRHSTTRARGKLADHRNRGIIQIADPAQQLKCPLELRVRSDRLAQPRVHPPNRLEHRDGPILAPVHSEVKSFWLLAPSQNTSENRHHLIRCRHSRDRQQNHWAKQRYAASDQASTPPSAANPPAPLRQSGRGLFQIRALPPKPGTAKLRSAPSSRVMNAKKETAMKAIARIRNFFRASVAASRTQPRG